MFSLLMKGLITVLFVAVFLLVLTVLVISEVQNGSMATAFVASYGGENNPSDAGSVHPGLNAITTSNALEPPAPSGSRNSK